MYSGTYIAPAGIIQVKKKGLLAMVSEAQKRASAKYVREKCKRVNFTISNGFYEKIRAYAEAQEESVNRFIKQAVQERIDHLDWINSRDDGR